MRRAWLRCDGALLIADPAGALVWPEQSLVVVADLHLEKGSALARRGALLPPYDTRSTLARLEAVLHRWRPRRVISLGDGFHDTRAVARLAGEDRRRLADLVAAHDWLWISGNHDPKPPTDLGGRCERAAEIGGILLRHVPGRSPGLAEIAGHLHPAAGIAVRGRRLRRRCFVSDDRRLLLPAFGSYAGGLDVFDPAIAGLFEGGFRATLLGERSVHTVPHNRLHRPGAGHGNGRGPIARPRW
jgi:DNA ligase-associated metallophosphoesterase